jgi:hypothetical protein
MIAANVYKQGELKVKRIALFSSGVGFYELSGELSGANRIALPFALEQMDDALKSLTIYDSASVSPFVGYPSEETINRTLASLRINLRGEPTIENILSSLKGESVEIFAPQKIVGKIVGVQTRENAKDGANFRESALTLYADGALRQVAIKEIASYRFVSASVSAEFEKALLFLQSANNGDRRVLNLYLDGTKKRDVRASFVVAAPVWKANYRLDLGADTPFLQAWAIIDNASDVDWEDVELSLAVGRPVSFTQPYYAPFYTRRPELPLSIAGAAQANTYESGFYDAALEEDAVEIAAPSFAAESSVSYKELRASTASSPVVQQNYQTANAKAAGEQYIYALKNKISLPRRQSAMAPLTQGAIGARKVLIYNAANGQNPALGIELTNTLDAKLPAGAITVYDDGIYAGDALLKFLPQKEKRLIAYGDDLSVRGIVNQSSSSAIYGAKISKGVIQITNKHTYAKEYAFKNGSDSAKTLILEHPITPAAKLVEPIKPGEKTESLYRFETSLGANKETTFRVKEERLTTSSVVISEQPYSSLIVYISDASYPEKVRAALKKAEPLYAELTRAKTNLSEAQKNLERKTKDQERVRSNLIAVGAESSQGKNYATQLVEIDKEIADINKAVGAAESDRRKAQKAYEDYIAQLEI